MQALLKIVFSLTLSLLTVTNVFSEPQNLGLVKKELINYYTTGSYSKDLEQAISTAKLYINQRIEQNSNQKNLAIVLDIDETSLSNYQKIIKNDFSGNRELFHREILAANAPVIEPMLNLVRDAQSKGVKVFFVTGRNQSETSATEKNLLSAGYKDWAGLYLRPDAYKASSIIPFKSSARAEIEHKGYTVIATIGDQDSDLKGGFAEKGFKLPNPLYYLP